LTDKASALLDKLQALPLEETVKSASAALASIKATVEDLKKTASGYGENGPLYQKLSETLRQLDETLNSIRSLSDSIERKPNSLIFGKPDASLPQGDTATLTRRPPMRFLFISGLLSLLTACGGAGRIIIALTPLRPHYRQRRFRS
jgi:hypothetical protein